MKIRSAKDIGIAMRERRRLLGLTQDALAQRIGVGRQWVVGVERGRARPDVRLILRAMRVLGLVLEVRAESPSPSGLTAQKSVVAAVLRHARRGPS